MKISRLSSGYWHLRGNGPCNFAQPTHWPCDEATLREHAFPEASENFIRECMSYAEDEDEILSAGLGLRAGEETHETEQIH